MTRRWTVAAGLAAALLASATPAAGDYETGLASRFGLAGPPLETGAGYIGGGSLVGAILTGPSISGTGRYVAFTSMSEDAPGADQPRANRSDEPVYRKDLRTGDLVMVSIGPAGEPLGAGWPTLSRDGRTACFIAPQNHREFANGRLYVRRIDAGVTEEVPGWAFPSGGWYAGEWSAPSCALTADGRKVAYATIEPLAPEDLDADSDVYLYDLDTRRWTLVSATAEQGVRGPARQPAITPDGRYVVFHAHVGPEPLNLNATAPAPTAHATQVYRYETTTEKLELVSRPTGCTAEPPNTTNTTTGGSRWASISDDGRYVAFRSGWRLDPTMPEQDPIATDGGYELLHVYVRDMRTCRTHLASRASGEDGAPGGDTSTAPAISGDGRIVVYDSWGHDLDPQATDARYRADVFARDWRKNRTALVSRTSGLFGAPANGYSAVAAISADHRRVAFVSNSDNLTATPTGHLHVYYRDIVGSRGLFGADRPGEPKVARLSYRRGRCDCNGLLLMDVSEPVQLRVVLRPVGGGRPLVRKAVLEEGRARVRLHTRLRRGRYRMTLSASDLRRQRSTKRVVLDVR